MCSVTGEIIYCEGVMHSAVLFFIYLFCSYLTPPDCPQVFFLPGVLLGCSNDKAIQSKPNQEETTVNLLNMCLLNINKCRLQPQTLSRDVPPIHALPRGDCSAAWPAPVISSGISTALS